LTGEEDRREGYDDDNDGLIDEHIVSVEALLTYRNEEKALLV